jgi:hypothetical protein
MTATFLQLIEGAAFQTCIVTAVGFLPAAVIFFVRSKSQLVRAHPFLQLLLFLFLLFIELIPVLYAENIHTENQMAEMQARMKAEMAKFRAPHGGVGIHIDPSVPDAGKYKIITSPGVGNGADNPGPAR